MSAPEAGEKLGLEEETTYNKLGGPEVRKGCNVVPKKIGATWPVVGLLGPIP